MSNNFKRVSVELTDSQRNLLQEKIDLFEGVSLLFNPTQIKNADENENGDKQLVLFLTSRQYEMYGRAKALLRGLKLDFHLHQVQAIAQYNFGKEVVFDPLLLCNRHVIRRAK